jgi:hypothetical protein
MPLSEERALRREAKKKHMKPGTRRFNRYVYGTLNKQGRLHRRTRRRAKK